VSRLEWAVFGPNPFAFHLVNVILHALNATLLVTLMRHAGVDKTWAVIGGTFFALHPAVVEAVAWINQLRSILALGFAMGSILALRKYPGLSAGLFAAAMLSKVSGFFALPVALTLYWFARSDSRREPISGAWLCVWVAAAALISSPNFQSVSLISGPSFANGAELLRNVAAMGARYILMATTSIGVSAFHQPEPVRSWANIWWLASVPMACVFLWRIVVCFAREREEAAWWVGAATAFGMIAQIFPLYYPMGDRYLYIILPGLITATLLWWQEIVMMAASRRADLHRLVSFANIGLRVAIVLLLVFFANRSNERAALWQSEVTLLFDSAANYPRGAVASWVRHNIALEKGDIDAAILELRNVVESTHYQYVDAFGTPLLAQYLDHPEIVELRVLAAKMEIERWERRGTRTQHQARALGSAYFFIGNYDAAIDKFEAALRQGGPHRAAILDDLHLVRTAKSKRQAATTD
jgi:hypothetical protein